MSQVSPFFNFKNQISKRPDLSEILPPTLAHVMPFRPRTKQILLINHYETPCSKNMHFKQQFQIKNIKKLVLNFAMLMFRRTS